MLTAPTSYYLHGEKCQEQRAEELGWGPSNKNVQGKPVITDNPIQQAIKQQSENACVQVNIAPTFWNPMGSKLLKDTIANVRDEG